MTTFLTWLFYGYLTSVLLVIMLVIRDHSETYSMIEENVEIDPYLQSFKWSVGTWVTLFEAGAIGLAPCVIYVMVKMMISQKSPNEDRDETDSSCFVIDTANLGEYTVETECEDCDFDVEDYYHFARIVTLDWASGILEYFPDGHEKGLSAGELMTKWYEEGRPHHSWRFHPPTQDVAIPPRSVVVDELEAWIVEHKDIPEVVVQSLDEFLPSISEIEELPDGPVYHQSDNEFHYGADTTKHIKLPSKHIDEPSVIASGPMPEFLRNKKLPELPIEDDFVCVEADDCECCCCRGTCG